MSKLTRPTDENQPLLLRRLRETPFPWSPDVDWVFPLSYADLDGTAASEVITITIPSSGFASSEITLTFSGGPLTSSVEVTQTADDSATNETFAQVIDNAVEAESALDDYVAAVAATNIVTLDFTDGQGLIEVAAAIDMAQQADVQFGGTVIDGDYSTTLTGGGLSSPVTVTTTRSGGSPSTVADLAVQHEADIEALIATTLAGVVQSADDDATDTNTILFEPGIADVTVTTSPPAQTFTLTFGGTATDGDYSTTFTHSSLPGGSYTVTTTRSTTPSTNSDLAAQHETDIEGAVALYGIVDPTASSDSGAVYTVQTHPGISGLTVTTSAPSPGTLTAAETSPTMTVSDSTPAAYTPTIARTVTMNMSTLLSARAFPTNMWRLEGAYVMVSEAFASGTTVDLGDTGDIDEVLDGTALSSTGYAATRGTVGNTAVPEAAWDPVVTVVIPTATPTAGKAYIVVPMAPLMDHPAA